MSQVNERYGDVIINDPQLMNAQTTLFRDQETVSNNQPLTIFIINVFY